MPEINTRLQQYIDGYTKYIIDHIDSEDTEYYKKFVKLLRVKLMFDAGLSDSKDRAIVQEQLSSEEVANQIAEVVKKVYLKAWEEK